jgi:hypothetical protein
MGPDVAAAAVVTAGAATSGDTAGVGAAAVQRAAASMAACGSMAADAPAATASTAAAPAAAAGSGAYTAAATAGPAAGGVEAAGTDNSRNMPPTATAGAGKRTWRGLQQACRPITQRAAAGNRPTAASKQGGRRRQRAAAQPLPPLFVPLRAGAEVVEPDAGGAGRHPKRVRWADDQQQQQQQQDEELQHLQQQELLQRQPCSSCGDPERDQLICEHCMRCWHLECLEPPLDAVPPGTWLCQDCNSPERMAAVKEALTYHSRWVVSAFWGIKGRYWGQLSYSSMGQLAIQYEDGERWDGVSVAQVKGNERLEKHRSMKLQPAAAEVP